MLSLWWNSTAQSRAAKEKKWSQQESWVPIRGTLPSAEGTYMEKGFLASDDSWSSRRRGENLISENTCEGFPQVQIPINIQSRKILVAEFSFPKLDSNYSCCYCWHCHHHYCWRSKSQTYSSDLKGPFVVDSASMENWRGCGGRCGSVDDT